MWTFLKVRLKLKGIDNFPTEWVLKIDSEEKLNEYLLSIMPKRVKDSIDDMKRIAGEKLAGRFDHSRNTLTWASDIIAKCTGYGIMPSLMILLDETENNQRKILKDGNIIYIKCQGSYSHNTPDGKLYEILKTQEKETLEFPDLEPRFLQWPNGTHWYVKFGEIDLEWRNKSKWDTKKEAEKAVTDYLENKTGNNRW